MNESTGLTRRELLVGGAGLAVAASTPTAAAAGAAAAEGSAREAAAALLADPAAAIANGQLWEHFCESLKPLAKQLGVDHGDPLTQVEGVRCLSRLVALGLDRFLEFADPTHPDFFELQTPTRKYLGDNPDQTYRSCAIDGKGRYRVRGTASGAAGVEIGVYAGTFRNDGQGARRRLVSSIDETRLAVASDGSFEISIGPESGGANHLKTEADAGSVLIRTYFWDRELRRAHAMPRIERLDISAPPAPLDAAALLRGLLATPAFVEGSLEFWNEFPGIKTAPNELIVMPDDGSIQTPSQVRYLNGIVEVDPTQALVLDFTPSDEPGYWSWVLQNLWGETPDWRYHPVVRNNRELARREDGSVRVAIAHRDPGLAGVNWMDMAGHGRLLLSLRWRGSSALPEVSAKRMPFDQIA